MQTTQRAIGGITGVIALITSLSAACSAPGSTPPATNNNNPPPASTADAAPPGPVAIPFLLSDEFAPSGYMGDSQADFTAITMGKDIATCKAPRSADAAGDCYTITWNPVIATGAPSAWVGVYWQYPANNWGAKTGKQIAPGASKVSFYAAGAAGGESLLFTVGGVNVKPVDDPPLPNKDSFTASTSATLTTSWTRYEIPLTGATYDTVIGGFSWVAKSTDGKPVTFYLDDLRWE